MKAYLPGIILLLMVPRLYGQTEVKIQLDTAAMLIGSQQKLYVEVQSNHPIDIRQDLIGQIDTSGKVEILDSSPWRQSSDYKYKKDYQITVFDSGLYLLQALPVVIESGTGVDTFYSNSLVLKINNPVIDTASISDIKPILEVPKTWRDYLPWAVGAVLLLALGTLLWWWKRHRSDRLSTIAEPDIRRPAHEIALQKLQLLSEKNYLGKEAFKSWYSELSFILREYLENRFHFSALEKTTNEISQSLRDKTPISEAQKDSMSNLLQTADLVKFAKAKPDSTAHDKYFQFAKEFVIATKKVASDEEE